MKTEFNSKTLADFTTAGRPAFLNIGMKGILFNFPAVKRLALKKGTMVSLEYDGGLFLKDDLINGFEIKTELKGGLLANATGLVKMIEPFIGLKKKSYRFTIGDFKGGVRALTLLK